MSKEGRSAVILRGGGTPSMAQPVTDIGACVAGHAKVIYNSETLKEVRK